MRVVRSRGAGESGWQDVPESVVQDPAGPIVEVETTVICRSGPHNPNGAAVAFVEGTALRRENNG